MIKIKLDKLILNHIHILALILLILVSIFSTNYYSSYKKNQIAALENIIENIYLKKTTDLFINSLKPRFETINYIIETGDTFEKILNEINVPKNEKIKILKNIIKPYKNVFDLKNIDDSFYFDTPGNILKYLLIFKDSDIDLPNDKLNCILYLIEKYKHKNDTKLLTFISLLIELFYKDLSLKNNKNFNLYSINKFKLLNQINDAKKFNLDKKNLFTSLIATLEHESK